MNVDKYLILIKKEDKTADIIKYEYQGGIVNISYKMADKEYSYSVNDFEFYTNSADIDVEEYDFLINGGYLFNLVKAINFSEYYKFFFKDGTTKIVQSYQVKLLPRSANIKLSTDKFEYFKDISEIVSIKTEDGRAILTNEYNKINVIERDTALFKYLNPIEYEKNWLNDRNLNKKNLYNGNLNKKNSNKENFNKENYKIKNESEAIIYPFGANKSQFNAVRRAMENQISIIEGPPGTGKTQTILNIIANIVKNGKTVAVVSNNNSATDNVYEKLQKYGLDYLCACLGKNSNKVDFIERQTGKYPKFEVKLEDRKKLELEIENLNTDILRIFSLRNEIATLQDELNQIRTEHNYFNNQEGKEIENMPKIRSLNRVSSEIIMRMKVECDDLEANNETIDLLFKLKSALVYGIGNLRFYRRKRVGELAKIYNKLFFVVREVEINKRIKDCKKELNYLDYKNKLNRLTDYSMSVLKDFLRTKYKEREARKVFKLEELATMSLQFNQEYPIVLSTTHSIKNCFGAEYKFDYIIMDEASQVDLITGVLALSSARNAVIVGDLKQLPNVITTQNSNEIEEMSKKYNIEDSYNYLKNSFLSSVIATISQAPRTMLQEHYRCHPKIIGFCNRKFYDNQLIIMTEDKGEDDVLKAIVTPEGNYERGHYNQRQIDVIEKEVLPELRKKVDNENIGIISPYRVQKQNLQNEIDNIQVDTVHKFQGREKDAVVITTVDNEIGEFVDDPKLLNVAITRAKKYLRVVVSGNKENEGTNIDDLIKYIQYNNFEVETSKIKSIYDLLYKQNQKQRLEYLKGKQRISEYDSENITYNLIKENIRNQHYDNLDVAVHVPLAELLEDLDKLEENERNFASKTWTHIDFVIFNKMDKRMVVAVEVDGYFYHKEGTKQEIRDRLKDKILEKYNIPLVRLNTMNSNEKELLEVALRNTFK